jgi:hypothetical protein
MRFGEAMDTGVSVASRSSRSRCAWCGAPSADGAEPCSSLPDDDLLLRYYSGTSRACNQQTWRHRRDLFDRADQVLAEEPVL